MFGDFDKLAFSGLYMDFVVDHSLTLATLWVHKRYEDPSDNTGTSVLQHICGQGSKLPPALML